MNSPLVIFLHVALLIGANAFNSFAGCFNADNKWTGAESSDWNNPNNWTNNNIPTDGDNVIIDPDDVNCGTVGNTPVIDSHSAFAPQDVTVDNGANLTINDTLIVQQDVTVGAGGGSIDHNKRYLEIGRDLTINGGTFYSDSTPAINATGGTNTFSQSGGTLTIEDKDGFPTSFENTSVTGGTIDYAGDAQPIDPNINYNNLRASGSGTKTASGNLDIEGDLTIESGVSLDPNENNMDLAGNWTNNAGNAGYLESNTRVMFDGTTDQTITNVSDETFDKIEVNKSGGDLILGASTDIKIADSLTLNNGIIDGTTNNALVIVENGAGSSPGNTSSYVQGRIRRTGSSAFTFPTGKNGQLGKIGISSTVNGGSVTFEAEYFNSQHADVSTNASLNNISIIEYWDLNRAVGNDSVQVTLFTEDTLRSQINDLASNDIRVSHFNGTNWEDEGQASAALTSGTGAKITSGIVKNYSPFTFGSKSNGINPLPVELLFMNAYERTGNITVDWATASEIHCDHFKVMRSENGETYEQIAKVDGNGTTNERNDYNTMDDDPYQGTSYYKLVQVDRNGKTETFGPAAVNLSGNTAAALKVYPNPARKNTEQLWLDLSNFQEEKVEVTITDLVGQQYHQSVQNTQNAIRVELKRNLPGGVYMVTTEANGKAYREKLIVE